MASIRYSEGEALVIVQRLQKARGLLLAPVSVQQQAVALSVRAAGASDLEELFCAQLAATHLPAHKRQFRFLPGRKFSFDFAWPEHCKLAVEVEGAVHRIKGRFKSDMEKYALALLDGWRLLRVGRVEIHDGRALEWTARLLDQAKI